MLSADQLEANDEKLFKTKVKVPIRGHVPNLEHFYCFDLSNMNIFIFNIEYTYIFFMLKVQIFVFKEQYNKNAQD